MIAMTTSSSTNVKPASSRERFFIEHLRSKDDNFNQLRCDWHRIGDAHSKTTGNYSPGMSIVRLLPDFTSTSLSDDEPFEYLLGKMALGALRRAATLLVTFRRSLHRSPRHLQDYFIFSRSCAILSLRAVQLERSFGHGAGRRGVLGIRGLQGKNHAIGRLPTDREVTFDRDNPTAFTTSSQSKTTQDPKEGETKLN